VTAVLLDTHAIIWLLHGDRRLSPSALQTINAVDLRGSQIAVSSISLVETAYLEEKGRVPAGTLSGILALLDAPNASLVEIPVSREIIAALLNITRSDVPDMPDRVIAATAAYLGTPLISHDARITASYIQTIW
jgi:PIN domain nuclease of toxin-antitoxin system